LGAICAGNFIKPGPKNDKMAESLACSPVNNSQSLAAQRWREGVQASFIRRARGKKDGKNSKKRPDLERF
jgi:hypothetical protein